MTPLPDLFDPAVPFRQTFDGVEYQRARVVRCKDGDTAVLLLDLGYATYAEETVRVDALHCAEIHSGTAEQRARGNLAWNAGQALLPAGDTVYVRTRKTSVDERDKYGRLVSAIRYRTTPLDDWRDYATAMRALGHDGQGTGA